MDSTRRAIIDDLKWWQTVADYDYQCSRLKGDMARADFAWDAFWWLDQFIDHLSRNQVLKGPITMDEL